MTDRQPSRPTLSGAGAGAFLLSAVALGAALGSGAGALSGSVLAGGIAGTMVGFVAGIALVIVRYRDL